MLAKVFSGTTIGLDGVLIDVEVDVANRGFPTFTIVGLPSKAVDEAKDRVKAAIVNTSFELPDSKITVNLAPADIPKMGSSFDLPMAIGILAASGIINPDLLTTSLIIGELSLEGNIRKVPGVISIALMAKEKGIKSLFIPSSIAKEATIVEGIAVYAVSSLLDLILHLNSQKLLTSLESEKIEYNKENEEKGVDFSDIKGQQQAKRALEIAAAGFHNIHLTGPPGAGKTLLSRAFPSILPFMEKEEIMDVSKIYSVTGLMGNNNFICERPFRSPHHTTSRIGLIGGGTHPTPGEISLAHRGVLFLDELPEFPRSVLESLRQPLEDGKVTISRANGSLTFPSRFLLLAASNPCPCGYLGHPKKNCNCSPSSLSKYKKRISGPLLDRIDLHIHVPPVDQDKLSGDEKSEQSSQIRERVVKARKIQNKRFKLKRIKTNGEMSQIEIKESCQFTEGAKQFLRQAISQLSLSARSYFKIIKVAQTIADLNERDVIEEVFVAEALQFRKNDEWSN
ncbi:MAG: YifB family Mg chelatase-like AAA ATPase [Candidatus Roizmanbacteria bacterium]|nr:MAG: YifB family Mg chelatase-like AAA ATPase [Candidatus Roizmanbacteria bacterium]